MAESRSIDDQIKQVDLELRQAELASKKRELAEQSRWTWTMMRNPAVIAGMIALLATLCTVIFGWVTSSVHEREENRRFQAQLNADIITKILAQTTYHDPKSPFTSSFNYADTLSEMKLLFDAGLLTDNTGKLQKVIPPPQSAR
jgi:hypothetical protein